MYVYKYKQQQQALLQKQTPPLNKRRSATALQTKDTKNKIKPTTDLPKDKDEIAKLKRKIQMAKKRNKFLNKRIDHYSSRMKKEREISKNLKSQLKKAADLPPLNKNSNVQESQSTSTQTSGGPTPTKRRRVSSEGDLDENVSTTSANNADADLKKLLEDERSLSKLLQDQLDQKKMEAFEMNKEMGQLRIELEESNEKNVQLMANFSKEVASKEISSKESSPKEQNNNSSEIEIDSRIAELQLKNEELSAKNRSLEAELEKEWCVSTKRISHLEYQNKKLNEKVDSMKATIHHQKEQLENCAGNPINSEQNNEYLEQIGHLLKKLKESYQICSQLAGHNEQNETLEQFNRDHHSNFSHSNYANVDSMQTPPPNAHRQSNRRSFVPSTSKSPEMNSSGSSSWHRAYAPPSHTSTPVNPLRPYMFFNNRR